MNRTGNKSNQALAGRRRRGGGMTGKKRAPIKIRGCAGLAFTLIELLVVIAIIMVLMALLFPSLKLARTRAERAACISNQRNLFVATTSHANDAQGFLPGSHPGDWFWGYCYFATVAGGGTIYTCGPNIGDDPLATTQVASNSLVRVGDWDTVWRGNVIPAAHFTADARLSVRKGTEGYGGNLAPYLGFSPAETQASETIAATNNWRKIDYQMGLNWASYKRVYLPRRVAQCPSVRPFKDLVRSTSSDGRTPAQFKLDARGYDAGSVTAKYTAEDNKEFMPSYGLNPCLTSPSNTNVETMYIKQYTFAEIYEPNKLVLLGDKIHPLMDLAWGHSNGQGHEGCKLALGILGVGVATMEDLCGDASTGTGLRGPYAPEPRHEMLAVTYADGHVETMWWSNFIKSPVFLSTAQGNLVSDANQPNGYYVRYRSGRGWPGMGSKVYEDLYDANGVRYWASNWGGQVFFGYPFINRQPGQGQ